MRVSLATHGGLAAPITSRRPPRVLDTERMPAATAGQLRRLVAAVLAEGRGGRRSGPGGDAMTYTITVDDGGRSATVTASDTTMSAAFGALLGLIERQTG
jgi:emfourin